MKDILYPEFLISAQAAAEAFHVKVNLINRHGKFFGNQPAHGRYSWESAGVCGELLS